MDICAFPSHPGELFAQLKLSSMANERDLIWPLAHYQIYLINQIVGGLRNTHYYDVTKFG